MKIRVMSEDDIDFAVQMTDSENWGYLRDDFLRLVSYEPEGCFVAEEGGERIGIVTTTTYCKYSFLGSLIVRKDKRGKGYGRAIMEYAIEYLWSKGVETIELDGVFEAVSLYRRLGFLDKYLSTRMTIKSDVSRKEYNDSIRKLTGETIEEVVELDHELTGIERKRVIKTLLKDYTSSTYTITREGTVSAYAIVRERRGGSNTIGPLVARKFNHARLLVDSILVIYKNELINIGVPIPGDDMYSYLVKIGFWHNIPSVRMYKGKFFEYERNVYGILSPEKG